MTEETDILVSILDYLAAARIFALRMNTGSMIIANRYVKFGVKGMADILAMPHKNWHNDGMSVYMLVAPMWIECKSEKGKQSPFQKSFQKQVEEHGHRYIIARSIDDVKEALRCEK